jgi:2-polyprenyl-3-methyl-5-hydroxy-6-metoxy-1,4-benzoquinol methylase
MRERHLVGELMDEPGLPEQELTHALRGLHRLNTVSLASLAIGKVLAQFAQSQDQPLRVLDAGCADGRFASSIALGAAQSGMKLVVAGCDINPKAIAHAQHAAKAMALPPRFFVHDMIQSPPPGEYDVVIAILFTHHLTNAHARTVLGHMARAASRAVIVNDLVRSRSALAAVAVASRVLSRSSIVHVDAVRSVRAAMTRTEMLDLFATAGLHKREAMWGGLSRMMIVGHMDNHPRTSHNSLEVK